MILKSILLFILTIHSIYCVEVKNSNADVGWSDELAPRIDWYSAQLRCKEMGMRLPSVKELDKVFKSGLTKKWDWKYGVYWTSEEMPKNQERAFAYNFDFSKAYDEKKSNNFNARCVK